MSWRFTWSKRAKRQLRKLDKPALARIDGWVASHFADCDDPTGFGKRLTGTLSHLWRYRVGDYRLLCTFDGDELIVLCVEVEHRSTVYDERRHGRGR